MAVVGYFIYDAVSNYLALPESFCLTTFNEAKKVAIDLKIQANAEWANHTILLIGFLWAILIAEKAEFTKIKIHNPPEILLFITANICYIFSLVANFFWKDRVIASYWDINTVKVPDIFSIHINALSEAQFNFFILGVVSTILLLLLSKFTTKRSIL